MLSYFQSFYGNFLLWVCNISASQKGKYFCWFSNKYRSSPQAWDPQLPALLLRVLPKSQVGMNKLRSVWDNVGSWFKLTKRNYLISCRGKGRETVSCGHICRLERTRTHDMMKVGRGLETTLPLCLIHWWEFERDRLMESKPVCRWMMVGSAKGTPGECNISTEKVRGGLVNRF